MTSKTPDLHLLDGIVDPSILAAMRTASATLSALGIRHALAGGLAVGAHGFPRATRDVDFLVGDEAFEHHAGGIVTMKPGVPIQVRGVLVDFLSIGDDEHHLEQTLTRTTGDVPIASAEVLAYLKLKSPRAKDRADLVELVKSGLDVARVGAYLTTNAPAMLAAWDGVVATARAEE